MTGALCSEYLYPESELWSTVRLNAFIIMKHCEGSHSAHDLVMTDDKQ